MVMIPLRSLQSHLFAPPAQLLPSLQLCSLFCCYTLRLLLQQKKVHSTKYRYSVVVQMKNQDNAKCGTDSNKVSRQIQSGRLLSCWQQLPMKMWLYVHLYSTCTFYNAHYTYGAPFFFFWHHIQADFLLNQNKRRSKKRSRGLALFMLILLTPKWTSLKKVHWHKFANFETQSLRCACQREWPQKRTQRQNLLPHTVRHTVLIMMHVVNVA